MLPLNNTFGGGGGGGVLVVVVVVEGWGLMNIQKLCLERLW